jgi:tRNA A-37 threonylcarbamoyl transferase component Bud32
MLSGSITSSFGYLSSLGYINLSGNRLSGQIPMSLAYLYPLYHLDLKNNYLNGSIPSSFGDLRELEYLILDNNYFFSEIPTFLGDISSISHLGLGNNQFIGQIPSSIGDLLSLAYLNLESNQLTGQIPQSFVKLRLLIELYLGENYLLNGLFPSLPGIAILDINGTNLYFTQEGSTASPEIIKTEWAEPTEVPGLGRNDAAQPINGIIAFVSSAGALYLAIAIGIVVLLAWRGAKNKREKRETHKKLIEARSNLYEMSVLAGNTENSGSELVFISIISSGAFGEVWKGIHRGEIVAIKKMKLERMPNDQLQFIQAVLTEAKMMRDMKDDHVVQFIGFDFRKVSIIMELMSHGALSTFIGKSENTVKWSTRYQLMLDICEGMAYLHSPVNADGSEKKEIYHQDLKSANVLLTEVDGIIRAKIGDFGLSCMLLNCLIS